MRFFSVSVGKEHIDLADVTCNTMGRSSQLLGNYRFRLDARRAKPKTYLSRRVSRWINSNGGNSVTVLVPFNSYQTKLGRILIQYLKDKTIISGLRLIEGETQNDRIRAYLRMVREFIPS